MYGPTGAGKTYTMLGNEQRRERFRTFEQDDAELSFLTSNEKATGNSGVLLYSVDHIFKTIKAEADPMNTTIVKCSYIEVYNETIYDLLQEKSRIRIPLAINELDSKEFIVKDAVEHAVNNIYDFVEVIKKGERKDMQEIS